MEDEDGAKITNGTRSQKLSNPYVYHRIYSVGTAALMINRIIYKVQEKV